MNIDSVYINFPAAYIKGLFLDLQGTLGKAIDLSLYSYYNSLDSSNDSALDDTLEHFMVSISSGNTANGRQLYQDKDNLKGDEAANVSISRSIFSNYFIWGDDKDSEIKRKRDVSPFNVYCLALYCGLKSIQGGDTYAKTNRGFLYKRVFGKDIVEPKVTDININKDEILGSLKEAIELLNSLGYDGATESIVRKAASRKEFRTEQEYYSAPYKVRVGDILEWAKIRLKNKEHLEIEKLKEIYNKYNTRHYFNKAIEELKRWGLSYYANNTRGFYFGTNIDYKSLVKVANKKKIAKLVRKEKEKDAEKAAIKELIEELKGKL